MGDRTNRTDRNDKNGSRSGNQCLTVIHSVNPVLATLYPRKEITAQPGRSLRSEERNKRNSRGSVENDSRR